MGIKNFFFDKKFEKMSKDKKIKYLKKSYVLIFIAYFIAVVATLSLAYMLSKDMNLLEMKVVNETDVDTLQLNENEEKVVLRILGEVEPQYLKFTKSITFTHNMSQYVKEEWAGGVNKESIGGDIIVVLYQGYSATKKTLCHELLHSFLYSDDFSHRIVYDLATELPCFRS